MKIKIRRDTIIALEAPFSNKLHWHCSSSASFFSLILSIFFFYPRYSTFGNFLCKRNEHLRQSLNFQLFNFVKWKWSSSTNKSNFVVIDVFVGFENRNCAKKSSTLSMVIKFKLCNTLSIIMRSIALWKSFVIFCLRYFRLLMWNM